MRNRASLDSRCPAEAWLGSQSQGDRAAGAGGRDPSRQKAAEASEIISGRPLRPDDELRPSRSPDREGPQAADAGGDRRGYPRDLTVEVARSFTAHRVVEVLQYLFAIRDVPEGNRSDNGPEFLAPK